MKNKHRKQRRNLLRTVRMRVDAFVHLETVDFETRRQMLNDIGVGCMGWL